MLTQIKSLREDTLVYELDGYVNKEDIECINDGIEFKLSKLDAINLMIYINAKGEGFDTLIQEFLLALKYSNDINKMAFISDKNYWKLLVTLDNMSSTYKEKYFDIDDIAKAWDWIGED